MRVDRALLHENLASGEPSIFPSMKIEGNDLADVV